MKATLNRLVLGAALLLGAATESRALSPLQHSVSGIITDVNYEARTITLAPTRGNKPLVFAWKDSTRLSQGPNRICLGALEPGQNATIRYRREVGQLVPRKVALSKEAITRCPKRACCAGDKEQ